MLANDKDYLATRVSYKLDLCGPERHRADCLLDVARRGAPRLPGLLAGECDMALAGGVSVRVPQIAGYLLPGRDDPLARRTLPRLRRARRRDRRRKRRRASSCSSGWQTRWPTATASALLSAAPRSTTTARRSSATPRRASKAKQQ